MSILLSQERGVYVRTIRLLFGISGCCSWCGRSGDERDDEERGEDGEGCGG